MKSVIQDDPTGSRDAAQTFEDWAPPVAPMAMPRQCLEAARERHDWPAFKPSARQGG